MPVSDQVRDDESGIHKISKMLDSCLRKNDAIEGFPTFYETIKFPNSIRIQLVNFSTTLCTFLCGVLSGRSSKSEA